MFYISTNDYESGVYNTVKSLLYYVRFFHLLPFTHIIIIAFSTQVVGTAFSVPAFSTF